MKSMRTIHHFLLFAWLASASLGGASSAAAQDTDVSSSSLERVVHFQNDKPLGKIKLIDLSSINRYWEHWLEYAEYHDTGEPDLALGDVRVPAGKGLKLWMFDGIHESPYVEFTSRYAPFQRQRPSLAIFSSFKPGDIQVLDLECFHFQEHELTNLAHLTGLKALELYDTNIGDQELNDLKPLATSLTVLDLVGTEITDEGLLTLQGFKSLRSIAIASEQITDRGVAALSGMPQLNSIRLNGRQLTDASIANLKNLPALEGLWFSGPLFSDAVLASVAEHRTLKELHFGGYVEGDQLTDAGLVHLAPLTQLRRLYLGCAGDEAIHHLAQLPSLEYLFIGEVNLTPACFPELKRMRSLKTLALCSLSPRKTPEDIKHDDAFLKAIHEAIPACRIIVGSLNDEGTSYPPPAWQPEFNATYALRPGEVLRRIPVNPHGNNSEL